MIVWLLIACVDYSLTLDTGPTESCARGFEDGRAVRADFEDFAAETGIAVPGSVVPPACPVSDCDAYRACFQDGYQEEL